MVKVNLELVDSKEFNAFAKAASEKEAKNMLEMDDKGLESIITAHTVSIQKAKEETVSAPAYVSAVAVKKDFDKALRERNKPLNLAVQLAAKVLSDRRNS